MSHFSFHFQKGLSDFRENNLPSALRSFSKCIQLDPRSKSSYLNHGVICNMKRIHEVAYEDFTTVVSLDPWELIAYYNRFVALMAMRRYEEGLGDLCVGLSLGYVKLGVMRGEVEVVERGMALVGNNVQGMLAKGMLLVGKGRVEEGVGEMTRAIEVYPGYRLALAERAAAYRKLNKHTECEQDINTLLQLSQQPHIPFALHPTLPPSLSPKQLLKQIQSRHNQFLLLRDEIFKSKTIYQQTIKSNPRMPPQLQAFADIMNLPSLNTNSLIDGELDRSKSFDKENYKKEKLFKEMGKFVEGNGSGVTSESGDTMKQILGGQSGNKGRFQSIKTYKSKAEFDSIYEESESTERQIENVKENKNISLDQIITTNNLPAKTATNLTTNPTETIQSIVIKQNRSLELSSQISPNPSHSLTVPKSPSSSRRSKIDYTDFQIQISAATLKRSTELIGFMSPYCQIRYGNQTRKTGVAYYSGKNPVWNHVVKFKILDSIALITLRVFDKEFFKKDDVIGEAVITIYEQSNVLELKYDGEAVGNIFIKMKFI